MNCNRIADFVYKSQDQSELTAEKKVGEFPEKVYFYHRDKP